MSRSQRHLREIYGRDSSGWREAPDGPTSITARYWRLNITAKVGAEAGVAELEFALLGQAKHAGGTASASSTFGGFPASNALDGSLSTSWLASNGVLPQQLAVDFGAPVAVNVVRVRGRDGSSYPTAFDVQYSSDGAAWTTAWSITGAGWALQPQPYPNPAATVGGKPLWRLNVTNSNGAQPAFSELQFRTAPGGANIAAGSQRGFASDVLGNDVAAWGPQHVFDGNTATTYHANATNAASVGVEFDDSRECVEFAISPRTGSLNQAPNTGSFQFSADGLTWTTAKSFSAQTGWTNGEVRVFT